GWACSSDSSADANRQTERRAHIIWLRRRIVISRRRWVVVSRWGRIVVGGRWGVVSGVAVEIDAAVPATAPVANPMSMMAPVVVIGGRGLQWDRCSDQCHSNHRRGPHDSRGNSDVSSHGGPPLPFAVLRSNELQDAYGFISATTSLRGELF